MRAALRVAATVGLAATALGLPVMAAEVLFAVVVAPFTVGDEVGVLAGTSPSQLTILSSPAALPPPGR